MARPTRQLFDNAVFHIIQRGNNKKIIFHTHTDYEKFTELIIKYKQKFPCEIYNYCFMPNHFHLLLKIFSGKDLPKLMQGITQSYNHYYRKIFNHTGYLYENRYKSILVNNDQYLLECGRYIEFNPVRAKIVTHPSEYSWSSYNHYAISTHNILVTKNPAFIDLGRTIQERQKRYIQYVTFPRLSEIAPN